MEPFKEKMPREKKFSKVAKFLEKLLQKLQMEVWEVVTIHAQVYEHGEHILEGYMFPVIFYT